MIDIRLIREDRPLVERAMESRGMSGVLEPVVKADEKHLLLLQEIEGLRAKHNQASKQFGQSKERPPELMAEMRGRIKETILIYILMTNIIPGLIRSRKMD